MVMTERVAQVAPTVLWHYYTVVLVMWSAISSPCTLQYLALLKVLDHKCLSWLNRAMGEISVLLFSRASHSSIINACKSHVLWQQLGGGSGAATSSVHKDSNPVGDAGRCALGSLVLSNLYPLQFICVGSSALSEILNRQYLISSTSSDGKSICQTGWGKRLVESLKDACWVTVFKSGNSKSHRM